MFAFKKARRNIPRRRMKKSKEGEEVLERIAEFLDENAPEMVLLLVSLWEDQQRAITYKELRTAILNGHIDEATIKAWQHDYTRFLNDKVVPSWTEAMSAAKPKLIVGNPKISSTFIYDPMAEGIVSWIKTHGAEWVTNITLEAEEAINAMIYRATSGTWTMDELSRAIRPTIGLTRPQALANLNYYNHVKTSLLENNPTMREATAEKRAQEAALKYAARQHRQRAYTIAQTELAFAYNKGADFAIKQAIEQGLMGKTVRVWSTAADESVCEICGALDGVEIEMHQEFNFRGRELFAGQKQTPPAHPNCRCAVEYREIEPPSTQGMRDTDGVLTYDNTQDIITVGGERMDITGASGAIPRSDFKRMETHAELYYEEIRNRKTDIAAIAKNTGFSVEDVARIKQHVFITEHDLGDEIPERFAPNYDMAVSWQRLIEGRDIREMDMVLLNHELTELTLMAQGYSYDNAHKRAEAVYNYIKYIKELDAKEGVF